MESKYIWRVMWYDIFDSINERVFISYNDAMAFYYDVLDSSFSTRVYIFPLRG